MSNTKVHIRASRIKIHYIFITETEVGFSSYLGGEKRTWSYINFRNKENEK